MSDAGKKKKKDTTETQEKVLTRYDLKMQRRREEKRREERNKRIAAAVGILLLVGLVCFVASFPIRSWLTVHGTYIVVADENVSRVEFDYNFNTVRNNYIAQNTWLSYFGLDLSGDLSNQMYSDTLTWQDFFDEMAVDNLLSGKVVERDMEAAGFTYDESEDYEEFVAALQQVASESGMTLNAYIQEFYGPYATLSRVEKFIRQNLKISAYYEQVAESKMPSDQEIQTYYEENRDSYDCVDYHVLTVNAELPTEPTELADPVEETDADTEGGTDEEGAEEAVYEPSQAEIDAAMELAKAEAESLQDTVAADGDAYTNISQIDTDYLLTEWLFDSEREKGDTTVIEDSDNNRYFVVSFDDRYIDPSISVNVRAVMTEGGNGQAILDEWAAGEATEESFAALADQYNEPMTTEEGGLFEELTTSGLSEELYSWLTDGARSYGDTAVITPEGSTVTYVFYYVSVGDPEWKLSIRNILLSEIMEEYINGLKEGLEVEDPHNNLNYLEIRAQEAEAVG